MWGASECGGIIMDGHKLVTPGTVTQQHGHCSTIFGGMLLCRKYIHPTDIKSVIRLFGYGEPTLCSILNACLIIESNSTDDTAPTGNRSPSYGEHSSDNTGYDISAVNDRAGDSILYGLSNNIICLDECNNEFAISDNTMSLDTVKSDIGNNTSADIDMEVSIGISGDNIDTAIAITHAHSMIHE